MRQSQLNILVDDSSYSSDAIRHGRITKKFAKQISKEAFAQSFRHWSSHKHITGRGEIPLLYPERRLYSTFATAINKLTPIHLSEWPLNPSAEDTDNSRRVDYWCLHKGAENGSAINYFIEIKKAAYCLSQGTTEDFTENVQKKINELMLQVSEIKAISPKWHGDGSVFLGLLVIHGYHAKSKKHIYDETTVRENIVRAIDGRLGAQVILSTWKLPDSFDIEEHNGLRDKCVRFISLASIVITKKSG